METKIFYSQVQEDTSLKAPLGLHADISITSPGSNIETNATQTNKLPTEAAQLVSQVTQYRLLKEIFQILQA